MWARGFGVMGVVCAVVAALFVEVDPADAAADTSVVVRGFFDMEHADVSAALQMEIAGCDVLDRSPSGLRTSSSKRAPPGLP